MFLSGAGFSKLKCAFCGNNPVPHRFYWYNESLNILLTPLRQKILFNPLTKVLKKRQLEALAVRFFLGLGKFLRVVRTHKEISQCKIRRAQVLWEEAQKRGIEMEEMLLFSKPIDVYVATKHPSSFILHPSESKIKDKRLRIIFSGLPRPSGYSNNWLDLMDDKALLKEEFKKNQLPVPDGGAATSFKQALEIFRKIQEPNHKNQINIKYQISNIKPVIVKPRAGSRGRHSTTFVYHKDDLREAYKIAKQLCYWVIVEEQLFGPVYRATLVNFELCGVLRGDPPQVVGDGLHTVDELIQIKNQEPHPGVKDVIIDEHMIRFVERSVPIHRRPWQPINGRATILDTTPRLGETINLSEKIGVNYGGSSSEDFEICHPDNKELFVRAAKVLGDPLVGFDFIIPDITKSWQEQKCGFIEVNSLPFINLHHDPLQGNPRNVAAKVWDMVGFTN